jgi:hypothetical protein
MFASCVFCVGSDFYYRLIARSEESCRMCVRDLESSNRGVLSPACAVALEKKEHYD